MSEYPRAPESIGQRLRRLRLERGLSQQQLTGSGLSTAQISRIESGKRRPSLRAIRDLALELRVSPGYLETGQAVTVTESLELRLSDLEVRIRFGEESSEAVEEMERVYAEAQRLGEAALISRALVDLGLVAADRGLYEEAATRLEQAIKTGGVHPATHPNVYGALGRTYWMLDDYERYRKLMECCLERLADYPPEETRVARTTYLTQLSYVLAYLGEFEQARDLLLEVGEDEEERADTYGRARLYWQLACISTGEGKLPSALEYARRTIALLETCEDNLHLARAHLLCGLIYNLDTKPEDAAAHLASAEKLFGPRANPVDLGQLRAEQSKYLVELGESERALAYAQEALELLEADPGYLGSAWHALAKAYSALGDVDAACAYFERAVAHMDGNRSEWREAAQACRGWAITLKRAGREEESAVVVNRAREIARRGTSRIATTQRP